MSHGQLDKLRKKDINVNTLFPSSLLQQLDEWAWSKRMTRSAALRALVELAFETMEAAPKALSPQVSRQASTLESLHQRVELLEYALQGLREELGAGYVMGAESKA